MIPLHRIVLLTAFCSFLSAQAALQNLEDRPPSSPLPFSPQTLDQLMGPPDQVEPHATLLARTQNGLKDIIASTQRFQAFFEKDLSLVMSDEDLALHIAHLTESWQAPPATKAEADLLSMVIRGTLDLSLQKFLSLKERWERMQQASTPTDSSEESDEEGNLQ